MDFARMQEKIGRGYGIAAAKIAPSYGVYRPQGAANPLDTARKVFDLPAAFTPHNSSGFSFERPSDYNSALFHGLFDFREVEVFDYLTHPTYGVYFVASMDPIMPPLCVQCNRTVTITRPAGATQIGLNSYGGNVPETEVAVMTNWPASMIDAGKGQAKKFGDLPGDVGTGVCELLLPLVPGVLIRDADILVDELDRRYVLGACDLQTYGWRCKAVQKVT